MDASAIYVLRMDDLPQVTRIHIAAFPKSALGQLGKEAVRRYYKWQLQGPHNCVALGICQGKKLVGFCFAGIFRGAFSGFLRENRNFLIWRVLLRPWLISNPLFRERLTLALRSLFRRSVPVASTVMYVKNSFGILSIAVDPAVQGLGYGKQLILEVERAAGERGFVHLHLTVRVDNYRAVNFYEKLGWRKTNAPDGIWRGSMTKILVNG